MLLADNLGRAAVWSPAESLPLRAERPASPAAFARYAHSRGSAQCLAWRLSATDMPEWLEPMPVATT